MFSIICGCKIRRRNVADILLSFYEVSSQFELFAILSHYVAQSWFLGLLYHICCFFPVDYCVYPQSICQSITKG